MLRIDNESGLSEPIDCEAVGEQAFSLARPEIKLQDVIAMIIQEQNWAAENFSSRIKPWHDVQLRTGILSGNIFINGHIWSSSTHLSPHG